MFSITFYIYFKKRMVLKMAKTKKLLSLLVVLTMAVTMLSGITAVSADGETITLKAPTGTIGVGEMIQVPVVVSSADGLTGFGIDVKWDPTLLEMSSTASEAVTLPSAVSAANPTINSNLVSTGEVLITAAGSGAIALTGEAVIATLNFKVLAEGNITLSFDEDSTNLTYDVTEVTPTMTGCTFTSENNLYIGWNAPYKEVNSKRMVTPDEASLSAMSEHQLKTTSGKVATYIADATDAEIYPGVYAGVMKFKDKNTRMVSNIREYFASDGMNFSADKNNAAKAGANLYIPNSTKNVARNLTVAFGDVTSVGSSAANSVSFKATFSGGKIKVQIGSTVIAQNVPHSLDKWFNYSIVTSLADDMYPTYYFYLDGELIGEYKDTNKRVYTTYGINNIELLSTAAGVAFIDNINVRVMRIEPIPVEHKDFEIKGYSFIREERTDDEALAYAERVAEMDPADRCSEAASRKCPSGDDGKLYTIDVEVDYQNNTDVAKTGTVIIACASTSRAMYPSAVYAQDVTFEPTNGSTGTVRTTLKLKGLDHDVNNAAQKAGHRFTHLKAYVVSGANTLAPLGDASFGSYNVATEPGVPWANSTLK